jgi:hypothetical protein
MAENSNVYTKAIAVTPSDSTVVAARALYIGGAGNVAIKTDANAAAVVFTAPPVGSVIPVQAYQVMSTSTTATLIVALY